MADAQNLTPKSALHLWQECEAFAASYTRARGAFDTRARETFEPPEAAAIDHIDAVLLSGAPEIRKAKMAKARLDMGDANSALNAMQRAHASLDDRIRETRVIARLTALIPLEIRDAGVRASSFSEAGGPPPAARPAGSVGPFAGRALIALQHARAETVLPVIRFAYAWLTICNAFTGGRTNSRFAVEKSFELGKAVSLDAISYLGIPTTLIQKLRYLGQNAHQVTLERTLRDQDSDDARRIDAFQAEIASLAARGAAEAEAVGELADAVADRLPALISQVEAAEEPR